MPLIKQELERRQLNATGNKELATRLLAHIEIQQDQDESPGATQNSRVPPPQTGLPQPPTFSEDSATNFQQFTAYM